MAKPLFYFKDVTLLITHYKRSKSLERLLKAFKDLDCSFKDIVVSDDGSGDEHLRYLTDLQNIFNFRLITTPTNAGLGNNINKGQDNVNTKYTLYIQEDFVPQASFAEHFSDALTIMDEDGHWDLITLYSYVPYPYMMPYKFGFSEKIFKPQPWYFNNLKFFLYGDHPHLRKSSFFEKFGRYEEGIDTDKTEMAMSLSFIKNKGKSLFYDDHYGLLTQLNSVEEPSTASFRTTLADKKGLSIMIAKWLYAKFKFAKLNFQLLAKVVK